MLTTVDWSAYAQVYDLMADNNPAYQDLLTQFQSDMHLWDLRDHAVIADLGAGTGNFSLLVAQAFPSASVVHLDSNPAMNALAKRKAASRGLSNIDVLTTDIDKATFPQASIDAVVTVHALYSFPDPRATIQDIYQWLRPGGLVWACDLGREMNIGDWARFLFRESYRQRGLARTIQHFIRGRVITRENRRIAAAQRVGTYWKHALSEYRMAFETAGFRVTGARAAYRGYSDIVQAQKPKEDVP